MVGFALILAIVTMMAAPDTPTARLFRRYLVEKPVDALARVERRHLILAGIIPWPWLTILPHRLGELHGVLVYPLGTREPFLQGGYIVWLSHDQAAEFSL